MGTKTKALLALTLFIGALVSSYFAVQTYAEVKIAEKINGKIDQLSIPIGYERISYDLFHNTISVYDITLLMIGTKIHIDRIEIDLPFTARKREIPENLLVKVEGISIPPFIPFLREALGRTLRFHLVGGYKAEKDTILTFLTTGNRELGYISVKVIAEGVPLRELQRAGKRKTKDIIKSATIRLIDIKFKNRGLLDLFISSQAKASGLSPEAFKEQLIRTVEENFQKNPEMAEKIEYPLVSFIQKGDCLELKVAPPHGLKISTLHRMIVKRLPLNSFLQETGIELKTCP